MGEGTSSFTVPEQIEKNKLKDLICRVWMRHDALWFSYCLQEGGIEMANRLNQAAVRAFAAYEGKQLTRELGLNARPQDFNEFKILLKHMFGTMAASFMVVNIEFQEGNKVKISWDRCFAFDGVSQLGVIEGYDCGIFARIESWFDAWQLSWEVTPKIAGCMLHQQGYCFREYSFYF